MPGALTWSALPVAAPKDISPKRTNVLARVALMGLIMTARRTSAAAIRELKKSPDNTHRAWRVKGTSTDSPVTRGEERKTQREREESLGLSALLGLRVGSLVIGEFKP